MMYWFYSACMDTVTVSLNGRSVKLVGRLCSLMLCYTEEIDGEGWILQNTWIRIALLLAIALLFQSIRLLMPMIPGPVNMFLIGSLLNAVMVLAAWHTGSRWAAVIGLLLPVGAFLQGQLPLVLMLPVVAAGNVIYMLGAAHWQHSRAVYLTPVIKAIVLYAGTVAVIRLVDLPPQVAAVLLFMMSWPQLVTGTLGIILARRILCRLP